MLRLGLCTLPFFAPVALALVELVCAQTEATFNKVLDRFAVVSFCQPVLLSRANHRISTRCYSLSSCSVISGLLRVELLASSVVRPDFCWCGCLTCARATQNRATAVLRTPAKESAAKAMQAAIDGGFMNAEFTLTTPGCLDLVADFRKKYDGKVMIGCGTIMDIEDAQNALDAGAEFIIMPVLVPEVVTWCRERNIVSIPGCCTPTELYTAYRAGAPIQKLFPGVAGGPAFVKAVSAALPMLRINPTSGVDLDNAGDFLMNGASGVGLVGPLFDAKDIADGNWDSITAKAQRCIKNVQAAGPLKR